MASLVRGTSILLLVVLPCCLTGCKGAAKRKEAPEVSRIPEERETQRKRVKFAIAYPESNSEVDRNVITIKGVGAQPDASINVRVFTDDWYVQDGTCAIHGDGKWEYTGCNLKGRGSYRYHHKIEARLIRDGNVIATATVDEITAPEP